MAKEWNLPEIRDWWLPDNNACPPVVRSIQSFMEDRRPQTEGPPRSEDQRNVSGVFSKMSIREVPMVRDESESLEDRAIS